MKRARCRLGGRGVLLPLSSILDLDFVLNDENWKVRSAWVKAKYGGGRHMLEATGGSAA